MNKMILWLFYKMLFAGTMFFAAAPVAVEGVADVPPVDSGTADEGGTVDAEATGESEGKPAPTDPAGLDAVPQAKPEVKVDGRALPQSVRNMMTELQKSDPKAHGFLKDVLFRDRAITQEFPGGLDEAKKMKADMAAISQEFPDGFDGVREQITSWNGIDEAWNAADPKVIDVWADMNPESFSKLMPTAMNKLAKTDPEGYQRYGANLILGTLQSAGINHSLNFLGRLVNSGDKEGATSVLKEITDWVSMIDQTAKSQPKAPEAQPDTGRVSELEQREAKIWASETAGEINPYRSTLIRKEAQQYLPKGIQLDDETFEAIDAQVQRNADKLLMADPNFVKKFGAYSEARDSAGLVAFVKQKLQDIMPSQGGKPGPVEKAVKLFFRQAPAAVARVAPKATPSGTPPAAPQGWEKVAKAPAPHEIDGSKSPFEMRFQKQAVLKSGKRVFWGEKVPA